MPDHNIADHIPELHDFLDEDEPDNGSGLSALVNENSHFDVWERVRLEHKPLPFAPLVGPKIDWIRACPGPRGDDQRPAHKRAFDTVLLKAFPEKNGLHRYRAARVRAIFKFADHPLRQLHPGALAYVELFSEFSSSAPRPTRLHTLTRSIQNSRRESRVVPVPDLQMACHIVPQYIDPNDDPSVDSTADLLDIAPQFFFNRYSNLYLFATTEHWQRTVRPAARRK